jgi:selenocysteine lyase/cysteine desulfurase
MMNKNLEAHFDKFRKNTIGWDAKLQTPYGEKPLIYADWIASGRLYQPIEDIINKKFGPYVANTHSESSDTGMIMTNSYKWSHKIIKEHVNADENDIIITAGSGMTYVVNKLQRILGMRIPEQAKQFHYMPVDKKPVVFITHMEHHSNHTSWLETNADVVILEPDSDLLVDPDQLRVELKKYENRVFKIGSFSACSNVSGVHVPYRQLARIMHQNGGFCFVDFAASAPYEPIDMHPEDPMESLDAIFFSPHKFLGGPGSAGVMVFNKALYQNTTPDNSGGGTVDWTNRWNKYRYVDDIEAREDGGTPGFLQSIRAALAIQLKQEMCCEKIQEREEQMLKIIFKAFKEIPGMNILANNVEERLGAVSFYLDNIHFNLVVRLLNDRFGIQVRGGCSCAGTYGHYLLHVDYYTSNKITSKINRGDLSEKPGWIRLSIHPTMSNDEIDYVIDAIRQVAEKANEWEADYTYLPVKNEYEHKNMPAKKPADYDSWFRL